MPGLGMGLRVRNFGLRVLVLVLGFGIRVWDVWIGQSQEEPEIWPSRDHPQNNVL